MRTATRGGGPGRVRAVLRAPAPSVAPDWEIFRNFNGGVSGTQVSYASGDAFDDLGGMTEYSNVRSISGGMSAKCTIIGGTDGFGNWGGSVAFTDTLVKHDEFWLQLYIYIPDTFVIDTPGNGSLKFLRYKQRTAADAHRGYIDIQMQDDVGEPTAWRMIQENQGLWRNFGSVGSITRNAWHRVTTHVVLDDVLQASGGTSRIRVWMDGVLLVDDATIRTLVSATDFMNELYLFTYWNGMAPQTQSLWIDDLRMAKNGVPSWVAALPGVEATAFAEHLPSGLTLQYDETPDALGALGDIPPSGWNYSSGTYGEILKVTDGTAPFGSESLEIAYPAGHVYGGGGNYGGPDGRGWLRLYYAQMVYLSSGYYSHENNEKYFYPYVVTSGEAILSSAMTLKPVSGAYNAANVSFTLDTQTGMSNSGFDENTPSVLIPKGEWVKIEVYMQMNTAGDTTNGQCKVWINGALSLSNTAIRYGKFAGQSSFDGMRFTGTRGGGDSAYPVPSGGQFRRYNRLAVYASTSF